MTWPRRAPTWFFGYAIWLLGALAPLPGASTFAAARRRAGAGMGAEPLRPAIWYPLGAMPIVACIGIVIAAVVRERPAAPIVPRETRA